MDFETLYAYGKIISNLKSIRAEREELQQLEQDQIGGTISKLIGYLEEEEWKQAVVLKEVEDWFTQLDDPEVAALLRWHYIIGYQWDEASKQVYGMSCSGRARKKISRYFGRE